VFGGQAGYQIPFFASPVFESPLSTSGLKAGEWRVTATAPRPQVRQLVVGSGLLRLGTAEFGADLPCVP
jgi:hypothetical protein